MQNFTQWLEHRDADLYNEINTNGKYLPGLVANLGSSLLASMGAVPTGYVADKWSKSGSSPNPEHPAMVAKAGKEEAREKLKAMGADPEEFDNLALDPRQALEKRTMAAKKADAQKTMADLLRRYGGSKGYIKK